MEMFTKGECCTAVYDDGVCELYMFVAVRAFSMLQGTLSDKRTTYIWQTYSDATKCFDHMGLSGSSD